MAARRIQLLDPTNTLQPPTMMPTDRALDDLARTSINALNGALMFSGNPDIRTLPVNATWR